MLLSVVIPTRNRAQYAVHTIRACTSFEGDFEVIVADNSDDDELDRDPVITAASPRIKFIRNRTPLSVVDNFNQAIESARGRYVMCMGDDDLITPAILRVAEQCEQQTLDAVNFSFPITYWWPDFVHRRRGTIDAASVLIRRFSGRWSRLDPSIELQKAMNRLGSGPLQMPRIYAGLVSRELLNRVRSRHGGVFGGVSPDVYSSTLLAEECGQFRHLDYPVVIPGLSKKSTSGTSSNGTHVGRLSDQEHTKAFTDLVWDVRVPDFYSVPTVWAHSMLAALKAVGRDKDANLASLYLKCLLYQRNFRGETLRFVRSYTAGQKMQSLLTQGAIAIISELAYAGRAVSGRLTDVVLKRSTLRLRGIENSEQAFHAISLYLATVRHMTRHPIND